MLFFQNIHIWKKSGVKNINQKQPFGITSHAEELSAGTRRYCVGLQRFNKSLFAVIPAGWESGATERHVATPPSSLCLQSYGPPKLSCYGYFLVLVLQALTCISGGPYRLYNVAPLHAMWLKHCCKAAAQGFVSQAKLES